MTIGHGTENDQVATEQSPRGLTTDSLTSGIAIMLILTIVQRMIGFLRQLAICKILDPEALGRWNLAYSMIVLGAPLIVLGIPGTFGRYTEHYRQKGQLKHFFRKTTRITVLLTLLGAVLLNFFARPAAWILFRDETQVPLIRLLAFGLTAVVTFNYFIEALTSLRQVRVVSWMRFLFSMVFAGLSIGLLCFVTTTAAAIVSSYAIACCVTSFIGAIVLLRTLRETGRDTSQPENGTLWAKLLPFAGWLWLADLLSNLFVAVDRYMIVHFADGTAARAAATVGQYHSSRLIPEQMIAIATMSAAVLLPYMSSNWEAGDRKIVHARINFSVKLYAIAMSLGGFLFLLAAPWLFYVVFDGKYAEGLRVTPWSIVACIWFGLFSIVQIYLLCCEKARFSSLSLAVGLVANVALNFILLPRWGLQGAVTATAASCAIALALQCGHAAKFGMGWNRGVAVSLALPVCITLPTPWALAVMAILTVATFKTHLIFAPSEKQQLAEQFQSAVLQLTSWAPRQLGWFHNKTHPING